ncbi:molybdopterin-guanine dinucleotide biosynthesis protein B [candidate division TA06 bacterium]|uniref:Molybdopterin-guanine dinucleotide biosynthesis protein B n=1 Tax=candidate division TA06 bacterium TaxID=2250710 RepID=A0A933I8B9_UNCT6|nr:molybdopterin-guanine dinucleotide biosynthesis protein B [candidate division TA06 bacterium]
MQPIISFVGHSNSGKTTLIKKIVRILNRKGYRVGVLKHTHGAIKADRRGTDTDRFRLAGAKISSISDDKLLVRFENVKGLIPKMVVSALSSELDLLIIEGYKKESFPKVLFSDELSSVSLKGIIATVGPKNPSDSKVRHFKPSMPNEIARWLEQTFILPARKKRSLQIFIDGKPLPMNPFVRQMIRETLAGMLKSLKGGRGRKAQILIDFGAKM